MKNSFRVSLDYGRTRWHWQLSELQEAGSWVEVANASGMTKTKRGALHAAKRKARKLNKVKKRKDIAKSTNIEFSL